MPHDWRCCEAPHWSAITADIQSPGADQVIFAISALCGFREYKVILAAVNVLFAVLFLLVGIMGEYFSVAFAELKNRPIYIVEKEINSGHCV